MATSASDHRPTFPSTTDPAAEAEIRSRRLAELVAGLTGCPTGGALHAIREHEPDRTPTADPLALVARAMVEVDGPEPEGFRVAGFLRDDGLVHHGSLRRWDCLHDEHDRPEDRIVTDRFRARNDRAVS